MAGLIDLVLERDGHDQPWGFRLQGGVDLAMPLSVQRVSAQAPQVNEAKYTVLLFSQAKCCLF